MISEINERNMIVLGGNHTAIINTVALIRMKTNIKCVGLKFLTAVVMKRCIFWDITSFSLLKVKRRFGGTCHICLPSPIISQDRSLHATFYMLVLTWLIRPSWRWRQHVPPKRRVSKDYMALYPWRQNFQKGRLNKICHSVVIQWGPSSANP
jgi:hypothetical protein